MAITTFITKLQSLKEKLSPKASINTPADPEFKEVSKRWSDHSAPTPGAIINVATEDDICHTIKWARANEVPFLAQSGGHGFTSTLSTLTSSGIIINLRTLNKVSIDLPSGTATLAAGVLTGEVLSAAQEAGAHIVTGVCNTVGVVSALLGGGLGNLISLYGLGVDNMLSARLITANGGVVQVSADENSELWWGLRGAGHNFGIVSQLTVKAYPQINSGIHWTGTLIFPGEEEIVEKVVQSIKEMGGIGEGMGCTAVFARVPPTFQPMVILNLWYAGTEADAKNAFSRLFDLGPVMQICAPTPYKEINVSSDQACVKGGLKPVRSVGLKDLNTEKLQRLWRHWSDFTELHGNAKGSVTILELYGYDKAREVKDEDTAFPWRECNMHILSVVDYSDSSLDEKAKIYGQEVRDILQSEGKKSVYMNFATGDESSEVIYGGVAKLDRLRALKQVWDPEGCFSHYNPIQ